MTADSAAFTAEREDDIRRRAGVREPGDDLRVLLGEIDRLRALLASRPDRAAVLREVETTLTGRRCRTSDEYLAVVRALRTHHPCADCDAYGSISEPTPDGGGVIRRCRTCNRRGLVPAGDRP